jgi:ribosomal protein RSM22 (predicted rRNA methylase)
MVDPPRLRLAGTARQWQLTHGQAVVDWMRSSGVAGRMLDDVCQAVETTIKYHVGDSAGGACAVLEEYLRVLRYCDQLTFDEPAQALAYLILHLPDRYCRMIQVLEQLLISGRLPMGKNDRFAVMDIGAGPGPGIFAIRGFYAALAHYAELHDPSWQVATIGHSDVVERGQAMAWVIHHFAEALVAAERGRPDYGLGEQTEPNPCVKQLGETATSFGAQYNDLAVLDIRGEHNAARRRVAKALDDEDRFAWEVIPPSAYALVVMMNFLTPGSDALTLFSEALDRLMRGALVPGGTILVLGAVSKDYPGDLPGTGLASSSCPLAERRCLRPAAIGRTPGRGTRRDRSPDPAALAPA